MRRFGIAALMAAAGVFLTPAAALAHAELISSTPAYGDRLMTAPAEVRLDFSDAMELTGSRITLQRQGSGKVEALHPTLASPDGRVVSMPLPRRVPDGAYTMVWYFLGNDGHLMAGEVSFQIGQRVAGPIAPQALAPVPKQAGSTRTVTTPQAVVRVLDYVSLAVLIGGGFFLVRVWPEGRGDGRATRLLWCALLTSAASTLLIFGLTAASLRGVGASEALSPSVMSVVWGTRFARIMSARALFLGVGGVALTLLTLGRRWQPLAGIAAAGVLGTHALLGHASSEGPAARLAVFVHLAGVAIWLGGLVYLAVVVLPRRKLEEVRDVLPRFSDLAFSAVLAMVLAGAVMVLRVAPKVTALPQSGYGRVLLIKLVFVALLLAAAQQARSFTERRLVTEATRLRPLLVAVGAELVLAVVILSSTSVLAGRVPPSTRAPTNAASTVKGQR
jgi:copper transport protein